MIAYSNSTNVVQRNALNTSTSPPNITIAKLLASAEEFSADTLWQQLQSSNEVIMRLELRKNYSHDVNELTSFFKLDDKIPAKIKSFMLCPVQVFCLTADANLNS